jgi:hypothetical protein
MKDSANILKLPPKPIRFRKGYDAGSEIQLVSQCIQLGGVPPRQYRLHAPIDGLLGDEAARVSVGAVEKDGHVDR